MQKPTINIMCPKCLDTGQRSKLVVRLSEGIYTWTGEKLCDKCKTLIVVEMEKCRCCGKPIDAMETCEDCAKEISAMPLDENGDWMRQDGSGRPY